MIRQSFMKKTDGAINAIRLTGQKPALADVMHVYLARAATATSTWAGDRRSAQVGIGSTERQYSGADLVRSPFDLLIGLDAQISERRF